MVFHRVVTVINGYSTSAEDPLDDAHRQALTPRTIAL